MARSPLQRAGAGEEPRCYHRGGPSAGPHTEQAAREFLRETEVSPDPWAYEELSKIKLERGDVDQAIALLEQAIRLNPAEPKLMASLAKAYLQRSYPRQAIPLLQSAIELKPNDAGFHYQLGRAYLKLGLRKEASAELAKVRELQSQVREGEMESFYREPATPK